MSREGGVTVWPSTMAKAGTERPKLVFRDQTVGFSKRKGRRSPPAVEPEVEVEVRTCIDNWFVLSMVRA